MRKAWLFNMIIEVLQVRANGAGVFEIYIDGSLQSPARARNRKEKSRKCS